MARDGRFARSVLLLGVFIIATQSGCHHPTVTAISLGPHVCDARCDKHGHYEPEGIPFYLPKPMLIVAKNFRNIEETKVGLTDSAPIPNAFDDQGKYGDLNARASFNFDGSGQSATTDASTGTPHPGTQTGDPTTPPPLGGSNSLPASTASKSGAYAYSPNPPNVSPHDLPSDGLAPNTFYTYQIVFVPDMTQKYGLKIKGGVGEIRAALNLVNGWQFTGLGPYYMKDSSTAQDVMASGIAVRLSGQAAQDVLKGVAGLTAGGKLQSGVAANAPQVQSLARTIESLRQDTHPVMAIPNYAQIYIFEARLSPDGQMIWTEVFDKSFERAYVGAAQTTAVFAGPGAGAAPPTPQIPGGQTQSGQPGAAGNGNASATAAASAAPPSFLSTGLHPSVTNMLGQVLGAPVLSGPRPAVAGAVQSGTPETGLGPAAEGVAVAAPAAGAIPGAQPYGPGLFHHGAKRRGTAISRIFTADDSSVLQGGTATAGASVVGAPTSSPPTIPIVPRAPDPAVGSVPPPALPAANPQALPEPLPTSPPAPPLVNPAARP
jgi:hypothetical protein